MARKKAATTAKSNLQFTFAESEAANVAADDIEKAQKVALSGGKVLDKQDPRDQIPVTKFYDPLFVLDYLQFKTKNASWALSYQLLRKISYRNGVIASIINTRINQCGLFATPYIEPNDRIGYTIEPRERKYKFLMKQANPNKKVPNITVEEVRDIAEISEFIDNCGTVETKMKDPQRDDFGTFLRKIIRDSLTFDQLCFEIVKDPSSGKPSAFYAVDSGTIRLSDPKTRIEKGIYYVQFIDGNLYTAYDYGEMAFAVRNPTTDIKANGYGISEIEMALNYISSQIYGEEYNKKFFTQGSTPKGIVNIKSSNVPREELDAFRRAWHAQITGVANAWKTPILSSEGGVDWINLGQSNRDMEFGKWLEYLVNIVCGIYQIDPTEINFQNRGGVSGQSRPLTDTSTIERIKFSKDKGLVPLLRFIEKTINRYIIYPLTDNKYEFAFHGYTDLIEEQKIRLEKQEAEYLVTVNELRARYGYKELPSGDIILNPVYAQAKMQADAAAAEQGQPPEGEEQVSPEEEEEEAQGESEDEGIPFSGTEDEYGDDLEDYGGAYGQGPGGGMAPTGGTLS
jgi:hypothetical protein